MIKASQISSKRRSQPQPLALGKYPKKQLNEIFSRFKKQRPEPKGELHYVNAYTLLVAVVLSAQATDRGVNKATKNLFSMVHTPQEMLALGEEKLTEHIRTIGLYRNKAKNIISLSRQLIEEFNGEVPQDRELLVTLPGVGRKTANVVVSIAFGQPTIAVDTHIFRISNRTGLAPGKTPNQVEEILQNVIPKEFLYHAHHWLILHGRYVCKARKPDCKACIIADLCKSDEKTCNIPAVITVLDG